MRELLQNPLMEKGRRSSKRQVKFFSIPFTSGKIKKKKKVNLKKAKCFTCGNVGHFLRDCKATLGQ